mgnify:CR=1 FL=1
MTNNNQVELQLRFWAPIYVPDHGHLPYRKKKICGVCSFQCHRSLLTFTGHIEKKTLTKYALEHVQKTIHFLK